jgi:hypothetical protein
VANNLDNFVPEIWSRNIIANIDRANVSVGLMANTEYEGEIREFGDTVHVRTFGNVTVGDYQRGQSLAPQDLVPVKETLTVDTARYFTIDVDDLDKAQNDINALEGYSRRAGVAMAEDIDSYLFGFTLNGNSSLQISNGGSAIDVSANTAGTAVYELAVNAGIALDELSVPQNDRWLVVSPYVKGLMLKSTTYLIRATDLGDAIVQTARVGGMTAREAMPRGFLGQMAGFDVWVSTNVLTNGANRYLPYGQGRPVSYAAQIPPGSLETVRLQDTFGTRIRGLMLHGGKVFTEDAKRLGYIYVDNS